MAWTLPVSFNNPAFLSELGNVSSSCIIGAIPLNQVSA
jgi:hypothetical protein